jgi:hypothetical protein
MGLNQKERSGLWTQRTDELLANLLKKMVQAFSYEFDTAQTGKGVHSPQGHVTAE